MQWVMFTHGFEDNGCAMTTIPDSARQVIESGRLAHLVTLNRDGSPQVSIVWVGLDGDEIVSAHLAEDQKVRNVRRDARSRCGSRPTGSTPSV